MPHSVLAFRENRESVPDPCHEITGIKKTINNKKAKVKTGFGID
jgi:hypothetical protein